MAYSELEEEFAFQIGVALLPDPEREFKFHHLRKFRFDFAWPDLMVAAEVEGGVWSGGRHTRGSGFERDCEKYNLAALAGWTVLRFTGEMVADGRALDTVEAALMSRLEAKEVNSPPKTLADALLREEARKAEESKGRRGTGR